MKKSRFSEEQIIGILRESGGAGTVKAVCAKHNISEPTYYAWKKKYGGMDVSEAQEVKQLRDENTKLKKLVVDLSLGKEMLKALIAKNGWSS